MTLIYVSMTEDSGRKLLETQSIDLSSGKTQILDQSLSFLIQIIDPLLSKTQILDQS